MTFNILFIKFLSPSVINGGFVFFKLIPSIPFFDEITIVPKLSASIILILVPDPNFKGTHKHFEKKIYQA